jgi:hypothetical protein
MPTRDVMILNFDGHTPLAPASFRPGHGPRPMGPVEVVRRRVDEALAGVDWSDPRRGVITVGETAEVMMEIDLGRADPVTARGLRPAKPGSAPEPPVDGFVVHVRSAAGAGDLICHLCLVQNWEALDCARGVYLDLEEPEAFDAAVPLSPAGEA